MTAPDTTLPFFYQMNEYQAIVDRLRPRSMNAECVQFVTPPFDTIVAYFAESVFERVGVLHGEYALFNGQILISREGACIKANMVLEDRLASERADKFCMSDEFRFLHKKVMGFWDQIGVVQNAPVLSHSYPNNYFHWTCEAVTRMRLFNEVPSNEVLVLEKDLQRLFQRDLLSRTLGPKTAIVQSERTVRVINPVLSHEFMADDAIHWLRSTVKIAVNRGDRRLYLRRTARGTRPSTGGGISETPEFVAFLRDYGFETVEFNGELRIDAQVKLLDGASVVLAAHGATLTNIVYLSAPLTVIEVIGRFAASGYYAHLSSILGFRYVGICLSSYDEAQNIVVDVEELQQAMKRAVD